MPYRRLASTQKELTIDKICWARYNRFLEKDMSVQKLQSHSTMKNKVKVTRHVADREILSKV